MSSISALNRENPFCMRQGEYRIQTERSPMRVGSRAEKTILKCPGKDTYAPKHTFSG